jgi:TonB family protein
LSYAAQKQTATKSHTEPAPAPAAPRTQKDPVFLVTQDDALWPQIGPSLDREYTLKQVDTLEELQGTSRAGQEGIIVWDARDAPDRAGDLSRLQMHSERFAIIVLDTAGSTEPWDQALVQRQIVALLSLPLDAAQLLEAFENARDETHARSAVLGEAAASALLAEPTGRKFPRYMLLLGAAILIGCAVAFLMYRHSAAPANPPPKSVAAPHEVAPVAPVTAETETEEQVDSLLEKARQAMLDRHFIDPAGGNALALYQNVLIFDPNNGEARQGLQRLAQILFARVQSGLDEHKTARSLSPGDPRLADLDARIETLRAELGPAQIQAALNAKNFDRATQLLDDAARAKSLSAAKLNQLRDEVRRAQAESDVAHLLKLFATRLLQDRLIEPHNDNAAYYLQQARQADASAEDLQEQTQALSKKLAQAARASIDQHRLGDVDRLLNELRNDGGTPQVIAGLQHDYDAARETQAHEKSMQSQLLDLAQARLAHGDLLEPENDNALFYVSQLRAANPGYGGLAQISGALQSAIIARAHAALDSGDIAKGEAMVKAASGLGSSAELDALSDSLAQEKQKQGSAAAVPANSLVVVRPLRLEYPSTALAKATEGWVDLTFSVTPEGKVAHVTVVDSSPHNVFDSAARTAMARVRYQPVLRDGKAVEIKSSLRLVFRLEKK